MVTLRTRRCYPIFEARRKHFPEAEARVNVESVMPGLEFRPI